MTDAPINSLNFRSTSEAETARSGRLLGNVLEAGTVIALVGNLGAGKTRLVQGIAAGLEIEPRHVNSPTFVLIQEYAGRLPVAHFDTYRLPGVAEFLDLGADEYLNGPGVSIIEWADRVAEVLPPDRLDIEISISGPTERDFAISARGPHSAAALARLRQKLGESLPHEPADGGPVDNSYGDT